MTPERAERDLLMAHASCSRDLSKEFSSNAPRALGGRVNDPDDGRVNDPEDELRVGLLNEPFLRWAGVDAERKSRSFPHPRLVATGQWEMEC